MVTVLKYKVAAIKLFNITLPKSFSIPTAFVSAVSVIFKNLRKTEILSIEATLSKLLFAPFCLLYYEKKISPRGRKLFSFRVDPISEGTLCTGKQTGSHQSGLR